MESYDHNEKYEKRGQTEIQNASEITLQNEYLEDCKPTLSNNTYKNLDIITSDCGGYTANNFEILVETAVEKYYERITVYKSDKITLESVKGTESVELNRLQGTPFDSKKDISSEKYIKPKLLLQRKYEIELEKNLKDNNNTKTMPIEQNLVSDKQNRSTTFKDFDKNINRIEQQQMNISIGNIPLNSRSIQSEIMDEKHEEKYLDTLNFLLKGFGCLEIETQEDHSVQVELFHEKGNSEQAIVLSDADNAEIKIISGTINSLQTGIKKVDNVSQQIILQESLEILKENDNFVHSSFSCDKDDIKDANIFQNENVKTETLKEKCEKNVLLETVQKINNKTLPHKYNALNSETPIHNTEVEPHVVIKYGNLHTENLPKKYDNEQMQLFPENDETFRSKTQKEKICNLQPKSLIVRKDIVQPKFSRLKSDSKRSEMFQKKKDDIKSTRKQKKKAKRLKREILSNEEYMNETLRQKCLEYKDKVQKSSISGIISPANSLNFEIEQNANSSSLSLNASKNRTENESFFSKSSFLCLGSHLRPKFSDLHNIPTLPSLDTFSEEYPTHRLNTIDKMLYTYFTKCGISKSEIFQPSDDIEMNDSVIKADYNPMLGPPVYWDKALIHQDRIMIQRKKIKSYVRTSKDDDKHKECTNFCANISDLANISLRKYMNTNISDVNQDLSKLSKVIMNELFDLDQPLGSYNTQNTNKKKTENLTLTNTGLPGVCENITEAPDSKEKFQKDKNLKNKSSKGIKIACSANEYVLQSDAHINYGDALENNYPCYHVPEHLLSLGKEDIKNCIDKISKPKTLECNEKYVENNWNTSDKIFFSYVMDCTIAEDDFTVAGERQEKESMYNSVVRESGISDGIYVNNYKFTLGRRESNCYAENQKHRDKENVEKKLCGGTDSLKLKVIKVTTRSPPKRKIKLSKSVDRISCTVPIKCIASSKTVKDSGKRNLKKNKGKTPTQKFKRPHTVEDDSKETSETELNSKKYVNETIEKLPDISRKINNLQENDSKDLKEVECIDSISEIKCNSMKYDHKMNSQLVTPVQEISSQLVTPVQEISSLVSTEDENECYFKNEDIDAKAEYGYRECDFKMNKELSVSVQETDNLSTEDEFETKKLKQAACMVSMSETKCDFRKGDDKFNEILLTSIQKIDNLSIIKYQSTDDSEKTESVKNLSSISETEHDSRNCDKKLIDESQTSIQRVGNYFRATREVSEDNFEEIEQVSMSVKKCDSSKVNDKLIHDNLPIIKYQSTDDSEKTEFVENISSISETEDYSIDYDEKLDDELQTSLQAIDYHPITREVSEDNSKETEQTSTSKARESNDETSSDDDETSSPNKLKLNWYDMTIAEERRRKMEAGEPLNSEDEI